MNPNLMRRKRTKMSLLKKIQKNQQKKMKTKNQ